MRQSKQMKIMFIIGLFAYMNSICQTITGENESWKLYDDSQVAIVNITIDSHALEWMYQNVQSDSMHFATVHFTNGIIDEIIDSVGFRLRGNTSRNSAKKSFKLSFNTYIPGRQFYGVDKLNLNGEHNDPSIIRSKLCWDFFQEIGVISSRAAHAAVYINGDYYGLYISIEHIDDEFLENKFSDASGNLWKCLWPADLTYRGPNPEDYYPYHDAERPYELKTNKEAYDFTQLARLINIINTTPASSFADSLEQIMVVPEVLKYFAMNLLLGNWDDYWFLKNNYYLYFDPSIEKFHWIPYDYDNSFGIDWFSVDWATVDPYVFANHEETGGNPPGPRPLAVNIMNTPQYRDLYSHFLEFYMNNITDLSLWESRLDSLEDLITPWIIFDSYRTLDYNFSVSDFHNSYSSSSYNNQHVKYGIKEFINVRNASLPGQISWLNAEPIVYRIDWWPKIAGPNDTIFVDISAFSNVGLSSVTIDFQKIGNSVSEIYQMTYSPVLNTKKVEEADRWIGKISPLGTGGSGNFQISVFDSMGPTQVYPRNNNIFIQSPSIDTAAVVINEFLAQNDTYNTDDSDEYNDWLELYNPTSEDIFLSGMYLTDTPANLTKWQFPFGGVAIPANGYLLVWCDNDLDQAGIHTNFKLSADGEFIALIDIDGATIIDSLTFGAQTGNISYGRYPDASDNWNFFDTPTPGGSNSITKIESDYSLPKEFELFQNYPNPFNPATTIKYTIPLAENLHPASVQLKIFDMLGRKISLLVNEEKSAGTYEVDFNAENFSSGVYFYTIEVKGMENSNYRATKKMMLIK
ncbi:CotH kinase family protein [Bacteroidota bacterium]